jgi:hypothetical protein
MGFPEKTSLKIYRETAATCGALKKEYASVMRSISGGKSGSTINRTGISRPSPAAKFCGVKQKHSVLRKYRAMVCGAILGTA